MLHEGKEVQYPQDFDKAQKLNKALNEMNLAFGLYDFGGNNHLAPLPNELNLNGKMKQPYIVVFE